MNALERLIYHEKQEEGSMMCAQHALNALLQNSYFSASDLGELARSLDELENEYRSGESRRTQSSNMDDTGYFSVQVLDKALEVWGLSLVRWRSREFDGCRDDPDTQQAFVLNLNQHWFTIRRFGLPESTGHWYNLNSSFAQPQRVGVMYLGMVLHQAETEGISICAVTGNHTAENPLIPLCEADGIASTIPDPQSHFSSASRSSVQPEPFDTAGFEGEDIELQRALQASLENTRREIRYPAEVSYSEPASSSRSFSEFAESARRGFAGVASASKDSSRELHLSAARSRTLLERATLDQQLAFEAQATPRSSSRVRSRADEHEDEEFRKAVEESLREPGAQLEEEDEQAYIDITGEDEDEDDADYVDAEDGTPPRQDIPIVQRSTRSTLRQYGATTEPPSSLLGFGPQSAPSVSEVTNRVIDDEDAELQAALKASLEDLPQRLQIPEPPKRTLVHSSNFGLSFGRGPGAGLDESEGEDEDEGEGEGEGGKLREESSDAKQLSVEEIRRRRLARFG
ncbi:Josephin-domain-containing protein [Cantharellus anzutake]|uniref:Josephin-domain-containing protein n=1 Tax=Cantharellus anzutake TaxID=1750568 RepID=UPI00190418A0|nr:Josephin-domain-containing protein [Cantharellus anzutake]KAF8326676.1 Josephin-domain-containing protein [Cantharellus anzutake]